MAEPDGQTDRSNGYRARSAGLIRCECGSVIRGDSEETLVAAAERHIALHHRALSGRAARDDILAMVEWS